MKRVNRETTFRSIITLTILLSGMALIPFIDRPVTAIGWKSFAGIYAPVLAVNAATGAPGSVFDFSGSNYPPNSPAIIYVNGQARGTIITSAAGTADFLVNTYGAPIGRYDVTLEASINASATNGFDLDDSAPLQTAPPSSAPVVFVKSTLFLPAILQ